MRIKDLFSPRRAKRKPVPYDSELLLPEPHPDDGAAEGGASHSGSYDENPYRPAPLTLASSFDDLPDGLPGVPDLYAILGVDPLASDDAIRYAYRRQAAKLHERRWAQTRAVRELAALNAAYEILSKPDRRADYDRRGARRAMLEAPAMGRDGGRDGNAASHGRGLPSGQRHGGRRLRPRRAGGPIEVAVIVAVIALALYTAVTVLSSRSLVDLSGLIDLGESLGLATRRRAPGDGSPTPTPPPSTPSAQSPVVLLSAPAATATPAPTPSPSPTATPVRPGARFAEQVRFAGSTARVSDTRPSRRSDVAVTVRVRRDGRAVEGARVHALVGYRTATERWPAGDGAELTSRDGEATLRFNIGDATPGHPVNVAVVGDLDGGDQLQLQTSFTPR